MKLLALAVASIVDANTNQGYTGQIVGSSQSREVDHIERGRQNQVEIHSGHIQQVIGCRQHID